MVEDMAKLKGAIFGGILLPSDDRITAFADCLFFGDHSFGCVLIFFIILETFVFRILALGLLVVSTVDVKWMQVASLM